MVRRLVVWLIVVVAAGAFVFAFTLGGDEPADVGHDAVEFRFPRPGVLEVRQVEVGIDLQPGWTGTLRIQGVDIPEDQLRRVDPQNQFFFKPGEGKAFEEFRPGRICATALIWRLNAAREDAEPDTWCFRVA